MSGRIGTIYREGGCSVECPECGAVISTASNFATVADIPNGLRWTGVRCACGRSYTMELTETPRNA